MKQAETITQTAAGFRQHLEGDVSLTDQEHAAGLTHFSRVSLQKGEYLVQPGNQVTHTYRVTKGLWVSSFSNGAGKEQVVPTASEHWWVRDQHAFYHQIFASFSLQAWSLSCFRVFPTRTGQACGATLLSLMLGWITGALAPNSISLLETEKTKISINIATPK